MFKKSTLVCYLILLALLIIGCQPKVEELPDLSTSESIEIASNSFDETYRPDWWDNIDNIENLHSYAFVDGSDQEQIKINAISSAQAKFLHYKKGYVVNLTQIILEESGSKDKFKSKSLNAKNALIYKKDYSQHLKSVEIEYISKDENNYRCFVAIALPLDAIQKEYVKHFQKNKGMASTFAKSETYKYLLKKAGLQVIPEAKIVEKKAVKTEKPKLKEAEMPAVKYDEDVVPAWFKIAYNNKKVMVNKTVTANSVEKAEQLAVAQCERTKMKFANNYARAEAERYREASGYDEIKFSSLKNQISAEVKKINYPLTKEFIKTIQVGENSYKTYAQYSLNKVSIQNSLVEVLKTDDVLYSRLRASMNFDELDNEDF